MPSEPPEGTDNDGTLRRLLGVIRVFILAETSEQAQSLADLLAEEDRLEVAGWEAVGAARTGAGDGAESRPDVALLSGDVALTEVPFSDVPVVLLSREGDERVFCAQDRRGPVRAWLTMQATPEEIVASVLSAAQGLTVLTPGQAEVVFQSPAGPPIRPAAGVTPRLVEKLTTRELQVLRMVAEGLGNKEIAGHLGISDHTAKFHVASILAKLRAQTRTEAVALGIRLGLVPI